jgi:putative membrane protein
MEPYHWWWSGFGFMWIFPLLFLIILALFLFRGPWWRDRDRAERRESPREILDRRYASGEITKEQYEDIKRTLDR